MEKDKSVITRRDFLKKVGWASLALVFGGVGDIKVEEATTPKPGGLYVPSLDTFVEVRKGGIFSGKKRLGDISEYENLPYLAVTERYQKDLPARKMIVTPAILRSHEWKSFLSQVRSAANGSENSHGESNNLLGFSDVLFGISKLLKYKPVATSQEAQDFLYSGKKDINSIIKDGKTTCLEYALITHVVEACFGEMTQVMLIPKYNHVVVTFDAGRQGILVGDPTVVDSGAVSLEPYKNFMNYDKLEQLPAFFKPLSESISGSGVGR
jgi:hypothetical protein